MYRKSNWILEILSSRIAAMTLRQSDSILPSVDRPMESDQHRSSTASGGVSDRGPWSSVSGASSSGGVASAGRTIIRAKSQTSEMLKKFAVEVQVLFELI